MKQLFKKALGLINNKYFLLIVAVLAYLTITLPAIFSENHYLFNLEPYPDAMFYLSAAENFSHGKGLFISFKENAYRYPLPPIYPFVLAPLTILLSVPYSYVLTNLILGCLSIFLLWKIVQFLTRSTLITGISTIIFTLHPIFLWLSLMPMTENISLPLFLLTTMIALCPISRSTKWLMPLLIASLMFVRVANIVPAAAFGLWYFYRLIKYKNLPWLAQFITANLLFGGLFWLYMQSSSMKLEGAFNQNPSELVSFSTKFVIPNVKLFAESLLGQAHPVLWEPMSLTVLGVTILAIFGERSLFQKSKLNLILLVTQMLGIIFFFSFFYVPDLKYIIIVLPIMIILMSMGIKDVAENKRVNTKIKLVSKSLLSDSSISTLLILIITSLVLMNLFLNNFQIYKKIIGANWLHNTRAWQYESIKEINLVAKENDVVVTALPPVLFNFYHENDNYYKVLPLSDNQEFIEKNMNLWGTPLPPENTYENIDYYLSEGRRVLVTNSYITHFRAVIEDYAYLKEKFSFKLVSQGCDRACDIFEIEYSTELEP